MSDWWTTWSKFQLSDWWNLFTPRTLAARESGKRSFGFVASTVQELTLEGGGTLLLLHLMQRNQGPLLCSGPLVLLALPSCSVWHSHSATLAGSAALSLLLLLSR